MLYSLLLVPTRDPSFCVNLDDDVCTRLALVHPNPCSDDCVANKICPHMCKKCCKYYGVSKHVEICSRPIGVCSRPMGECSIPIDVCFKLI